MNTETNTSAPLVAAAAAIAAAGVTVGVPSGVDPEKVKARKILLIQNGTEPLIAEKLAIDAELHQQLHDKKIVEIERKREEEKAARPVSSPLSDEANRKASETLAAIERTRAELERTLTKAKADAGAAAEARNQAEHDAARVAQALAQASKAAEPATPKGAGAGNKAGAMTALLMMLAMLFSMALTVPVAYSEISDSGSEILEQVNRDDATPATQAAMPAIQWTGGISVVLLGALASTWLTKRERNRLVRGLPSTGAMLRYRWRSLVDRLQGQGLAFNTVMTPTEVNDGIASLDGTAAIATRNYLVVRGADDTHFKVTAAVTDVPLGILLQDTLDTDEIDVVKKAIALFGQYQGTLPGVAAAAIAVDAWLVPDLAVPGRVKTLPTTPGTYWVIGRNRKTVANAGDPVSIEHCVPFQQFVQATGSVNVAGATLAIPVTKRYVAKTTGGAEALTLANGVAGQKLNITLAVDGGDGTLTPTTKTGFTTVVFADAGDQVALEYIDDTIGWILLGYAGTAAPPVIT
jgi:hypothetical protein